MSSQPSLQSDEFCRKLAEARAGSTEAMGWLWTQCRNYLLLVANKDMPGDVKVKESPSDLVQQTFLEAQRDFAQFQGEREEELQGWLRRILANNILNKTRYYKGAEKRSLNREVRLPAQDDSSLPGADLICNTPTPSDKAIAQEDLLALERALAQLPEHYQQVIRLRYDQQMTFPQIGEVLGCSDEAARKLWGRAVANLEKVLNPHNES